MPHAPSHHMSKAALTLAVAAALAFALPAAPAQAA